MRKKDKDKKHGDQLSISEKLYKKFDFPAEIVSSCTLEITGRNEASICGCRRIAVFTPELIRLEMKDFDLIFEGDALNCPAYGGGRIVLAGIFKSITYEKRG
ncbi:MAG: YabP/YqfC family sporulation protein [Clostridia bacterium]|nr:YabP/YqfC family sporulation protein [Clostridia bacterium]